MGTATSSPPVIGADCAFCEGTLWEAHETPRFIHVEFKDLVMCVGAPLSPPNAIWVLEQDAIDPCKWVYQDNKFRVIVEVGGGGTEVGCIGQGVAAGKIFFRGSRGGCESNFNNLDVACGGGVEAHHGTATITWS